jgi:hypothetical protein
MLVTEQSNKSALGWQHHIMDRDFRQNIITAPIKTVWEIIGSHKKYGTQIFVSRTTYKMEIQLGREK